MNIWQLQILTHLAELGTMNRVAEALFVSPATISQQLKDLEDDLELTLIEKQGRKVYLNQTGQELVERAQPVLSELETIENDFKTRQSEITGIVRIATFTSALNSILIPVIKKINQTFPSIECRIYEEEPDQSLLGLRSHKFDIVLSGYFAKKVTFPNSDIISTNIGEDKLLVVSSKDDKSIFPIKHFSDLASKKWIIEPKNTYLSTHIIQMCRENLFDPDVVSEIHSYDAIKSLVKSQLGISILPSLALTAGTDMNGIFVHDFDTKSKRQIYLLERKPQKRIPAIKIVSQMITDQATAVLKNFN